MKPLFLAGALLASCGALCAADKALTIAVIPKGTTHEFWKSINAGAFKARDELAAQGVKVDVIWKGPYKEDDRDQQIQTVENFITRRVSGIVLAPLDSQALVRPVATAQRAKVPVVIIDSGLKSENYVSFVATDNYKGGVLAGEHLGKLLGGKGNVILLRYAVGSASTEERETGFLDTLKQKFPEIKLLSSDQYAGPTRETGYQASQNLLNRFGREVHGIFAPCEPPTIAMAKALRDRGLAGGKVKMVGFDAGSQSVADLKNGDVQGLVVQNPVFMGYKGVMTMVEHLQGRKVEKRIDTGVVLVSAENMEQAAVKELLYPPLDRYLNSK
ncbi:MAG TPA: substrate-binding domain-containing protein [Verrucomicrobiae bacterium]|nr:substrate-binding domain-containing protein [Verrucomicrobiae bacterium]